MPLIVPEVNSRARCAPKHRLFPVANCTAIVLCTSLAPIRDVAGLRAVRVATYQAASGAGRQGLDELLAGERALARGEEEPLPAVFPRRLARNVVPQIGAFDASGYSGEERKVREETRKMLELPELFVSATAVRVPVRTAHSEAVFVETERPTSVAELSRRVRTRAEASHFRPDAIVTPRDVEGTDLVHVARLRTEDERDESTRFAFWCVGDQLRKGAATNARADPGVAARLKDSSAHERGTKRIAVLKFGGTSVASRERREVAVQRVRDALDSGFPTVAVVSAMGRPPDPYATDSLLELIGGRDRKPQRRRAPRGRRTDRGCSLRRRTQRGRNPGGGAFGRAGRDRHRRTLR